VGVDEHTITLDQTPVFYRSAPAQGIPALYLHGVPTSSEDWASCLERAGGVAPDLIGFGRSAKGGHLDYSLPGLVSFIAGFLQELEIERVKVVAHDWGAAAGLLFAAEHPERVERLAFCNPLPLVEGFRWHRLARLWRLPAVGEVLMGATNRWLLGRILRHASGSPQSWSRQRVAAVWELFDQGTQRATLRLHRSADEQWLAAAGAKVPALDVPALVLWGERDPWLVGALADAFVARLPRARLERVTDAAHWPWLERPELADHIAEFLLEES